MRLWQRDRWLCCRWFLHRLLTAGKEILVR